MMEKDKKMYKMPDIVSTIMKHSLTGTVEMINNIKKYNSNEQKNDEKTKVKKK